jgi:hypothetical protein
MSLYGFNEGYSLSASPLSSFPAASKAKVVKTQGLYTPPIINLNPMTPAQSFQTMTVGAKAYAFAPPPQVSRDMCANAMEVSRMGASLCMDPMTRQCAPPPVPSQCPQGHLAVNQFSGALSASPSSVTWGMMTY